jgi:hypothetical protein
MLNWIIARLEEPSTWAGLSALALAMGVSEAQWHAVSAAGAAVFAAIAVFLKEPARPA